MALLATASASANSAVIYVHGTGDQPSNGWMFCGNGNNSNAGAGGARCSFDPVQWKSDSSCGTYNYSCGPFGWFTCSANNSCWVQNGAAANYWTQGNIYGMANGEQYLVVNYNGASQDPTVSWGKVVDQIQQYLWSFPSIDNITIVTHSDGANVVRYMEAHPTQPSPTGSGITFNNAVGAKLKATIFIAGSMEGTPLADAVSWVINLPVIGDIADLIIGGIGYAGPAVLFQTEANMYSRNRDWTFGATPDEGQGYTSYWLNGAYVWNFAGQGTSYNVFGGQCDSYWEAFGLWTVSGLVGWNNWGTNPSGNTDGFIGQGSATYMGMGWMTSNNQQNHNQSRRNCGSVPSEEQYILYGVNNWGW
ncbi:MAG: hypothetical protein ACHREM_20665 [Polyangiales bacterium]